MRSFSPLILLSILRLAHTSTSPASSIGVSSTFRLKKLVVTHRHGDRTPITPLKDEEYWASTLVDPDIVEKIGQQTYIIRGSTQATHVAKGRGPFGKLTRVGLLQMIKVGINLRETYFVEKQIAPKDVQVFSTDFPRTIQSVQGLLVGLFPDDTDHQDNQDSSTTIKIDARNTNWMIPDPQPRRTREQEELENALANREFVVAKEMEMLPLAIRATKALHPLLGKDAHEFSFGVGEIEHPGDTSIEMEPLAWNQLAEITKCLAVRNMLPPEISEEDQEAIGQHAAYRWFVNLRNERLIHLAMNTMVQRQCDSLLHHAAEPFLTIWSAHDSTLIGLLCAYRLEQPVEWPEYASYFVMELLEDCQNKDLYVKFSINGQVLRNTWKEDEPRELISLRELINHLQQVPPPVTNELLERSQ